MNPIFTADRLREICIREDWFTGGTVKQYEKFFERAKDGAEIEELALIIWLCTSDVTRENIEEILRKERENGTWA